MAFYRVEGDGIAEARIEEDRLGLLEDLEAVDPPRFSCRQPNVRQ